MLKNNRTISIKYLVLFLFFLNAAPAAKAQSFKEINDSLLYYYQSMHFKEAIPFAEKALAYVKENYGTDNKFYPTYLSLIGGIYVGSSQFSKAEPVFLEIISIYKKINADSTKEYIKSVSMLAIIYNTKGEDEKAVPLFKEAIDYYKRTAGEADPEYASAINKLAKVYDNQGQYEQAAELFSKSRSILAKTTGILDPEYATVVNNLGLVYKKMGLPEKAEPLLLQAMDIRKKAGDEYKADYANSLGNLAVLYESLGQFDKAKEYYIQAAGIYKNKKGPSSAEYITSLTNLGSIYESTDEYEKAETILQEAMKIAEKEYDEDWPLRLNITKNLGQLYLSAEKYDKAAPLLQKVAAIEEQKNNTSDAYSSILNDIAYLYNHTDRLKEAEEAYRKSAAISKATLGPVHANYAATLNNLALLYVETGRYAEAIPLLTEVTAIKTQNLLSLFAVLSESEKSQFIANNIFLQHSNLSLLYNYPAAPASFYRENYNLQLLMKSLLLTDSKNVVEYVRASKDTAIKNIFYQWETDKSVLSKEYSLPLLSRRPDLKNIEEETETLEKELIRRSSGLRNLKEGMNVKMEDVQQKLKEDEAAIEFVQYSLLGKDGSVKSSYAALVITKNDSAPAFVPLCDENQLQHLLDSAGATAKTRVKNFYRGLEVKKRNTISLGQDLYKLVWSPLEPYLKNINSISYSPAGKLYSIAFQALPVDSNTLLIDKYNLRQYTSTREVALRNTENQTTKPSSIILFGNADFSMDSLALAKQRTEQPAEEAISTSVYTPPTEGSTIGAWNNLPGTADEIKKIGDILQQNKATTKLLMQKNASEKNLKALSGNSPQILHIATHGYFLPEPDKTKKVSSHESIYTLADNPLLRSGLILSGGNYAWSGKNPIEGVEDGIVTAYEISQLNLANTELVVLSACETGLGDVKGSEGVFGLQRAFKMAGVKKMIVSLWQVPDKETAELMTTFYPYWVKGKSINDAFTQAQAAMRKKYSPFYWAAFILVE